MATATREAYGQAIAKLVQENEKVVVLDADLAGSTYSIKAKQVAPDRFFDMGIAEANMIGVSAGFATSGYIPFASSFAMFCTGRVWEQVRNSVCYPNLNVKIVGSHSGITVGEDGVTHQAIEDIAIMRAMTNMEVYVPCDQYQTKAIVEYLSKKYGPAYIRIGRSKVEDVYSEDTDFDFTKIRVLQKGRDIAVFACGLMVQSTLEAAKRLAEEGIHITVVDVCAIKPCDEKGIQQILDTHSTIFTVEEHSIIGGLGSMVAEVSTQTTPRIIHRLGMKGFGESGNWKQLLEKYQLDGQGVYQQIKEKL